MTEPHVYIVILNFRGWQDTRECLASVLASGYSNYSVVVLDNASGDDSLQNLADWARHHLPGLPSTVPATMVHGGTELLERLQEPSGLPRISFIQLPFNGGFAAGNNTVLAHIWETGSFVWLLNPDMTVEPGTLAALVQFAVEHPVTSIIGSQVRSYGGNHSVLFYGGGKVHFRTATVQLLHDPGRTGELDFICGGSLFTKAINFKMEGLLPEHYFLYWEETEWCYRARQHGAALLVCPDAVCYDKEGTSVGRGFLADYYYTRNGLLFVSRFRRRVLPLALAAALLRWFKRVLTGHRDRARGLRKGVADFLKKRFGAYA